MKRGVVPECRTMHGTCRHCGAVIECLRFEVKADDTVACPTVGCGHRITVFPGDAESQRRRERWPDPTDDYPGLPMVLPAHPRFWRSA